MNTLHHHHLSPANMEITAELGRQLRTLREQKSLTIGDVAERLKLPVRQIEALENGLYESLPEPVYVRGFLLSYGRFLDMDEVELTRSLNVIAPPQSYRRDAAAMGLNYTNTRIKKGFPKWIFFVLITGCIGLAVYMWQHKSNLENEKQESVSTIPVENNVVAPNLNLDNLMVKPMTASDTQTTSVAASGVAASQAAAPVAAVAGELVITTRYRTMLTVTNAQGKVLINKIVPAASEHRFTEGAPFEVRMGYASGSKVRFAGKEVDLESKPKDGKSVAFTVGANQ